MLKKEIDLALKVIKKVCKSIKINSMKNFINLKDIPASDLRKIINDAKKRKNKRKNLNTLDIDKDKPLKENYLFKCMKNKVQEHV